MSVDANAEFLEFRNVDKIKFIGTSSNTIIDTTTGRLGIGTDTPAYAIDVRGTANVTALSGITDFNFQPTSNTASIEYDSNVVTEFNRSKKLIKYPRVALTSGQSGLGNGYTQDGYTVKVSNESSPTLASYAFNGKYGDNDVTGAYWYTGNLNTYNGTPTGGYYVGSVNLGSDGGRTATVSGDWIELELPNKIKLEYFKYFSQNDGVNGAQDGVLYARNTTNEDWTLVHSYTDALVPNQNTAYTFNVNSTNHYKIYALVLTRKTPANTGTGGVSVGELEFYGLPEYDPDAAGVDVKVTSYPNVPNTDWLEVYYDAKNYTSGNNVQDETANNRDGVLYGNTSFSSADGIHKFNFDGSGDYIESLNITSISGNQTMSSSVWVKFTSWNNTTYDFIYSLGDRTVSGNGTEYSLVVNHQTNGLYIGTNGLAGTAATLFIPDLERWYHFATTYDGDTNHIFIDGTLRNSELLIGDLNLPTSGCDLVLGGDTASSRGQLMNGSIANFRLFNRALTQDEVWQLYAYQKEYFGHGDLSMTLKAGRLGIGTSEPKALLDVGGVPYGAGVRPMLSAYEADGYTFEALDNVQTDVILGNTFINHNNAYNTSTGVFTVPVTGEYHIFACCQWRGFSNYNQGVKSGYINFVINGVGWNPTSTSRPVVTQTIRYANERRQLNGSLVIKLNTGDQLKVQCTNNLTANVGDLSWGTGYGRFSVFLLS